MEVVASKSRNSVQVRWPFVALVLIVGSVASWRILQRDPLYRDTARFGQSVFNGDVRGLTAVMLPEEKNGCGVTEDNLRVLWRDFIKPRLNLAVPVGETNVERLHSTAVSEQTVRYANGLSESWAVGLSGTSEGGRTRVLSSLLMMAYRAEVQSRSTERLESVEMYPQWADFIERDRSYFESLGLRGVYGPLKGVVTWAQWATELRAGHAHYMRQQ